MHVHLPKPMHGWREFAGEVGIIVVGVLIALGAEQVVETLHWRQQAKDAQASLKTEIQDSVNSAAERQAVDDCLRRQLVDLRDSVTTADGGKALHLPSNEGRVISDLYATPWRAWARGVWETAVASNVLDHVAADRLDGYAQIYKAIQDFDDIVRRERDAKGGLAPLSLGTLDKDKAGAVLGTLTNLDRDRADILIASHDLREQAAKLGIRTNVPALKAKQSFTVRYGVTVCQQRAI